MTKAKKQQIDKKTLVVAFDTALNNWMTASSTDMLLAETGKTRQQLLDAVLADDEVESCREDIRTAMLAAPWRIWGEDVDEAIINRLYRMVRRLLADFAELAILAKFNGFAVAEYVFRQDTDGLLILDKVLSKDGELDSYEPQRNGELLWHHPDGDVLVNQQVKYLLLTSKAVPARPAGELMIIRAYPAVALRKREWAYAGQFIARYAQPYVVAKQGDSFGTSIKDFASTIFGFINGGATGIGRDDEINLHQLNGNGDAFELIERLANRRIQKLLLGRVKTSELTAGSRSAQETDDAAREDRMSAYLDLMARAVQHACDAVLAVNQYWGLPIHAPQGIWFEYQQQFAVDKTRAERDKLYCDTGQMRLTKAYLTDIVGYEEGHIEMVEMAENADIPPTAGSADFSLSQSPTVPPPDNQPIDAIAPADNKLDTIIAALADSDDYADFARKLDVLVLPDDGVIADLAKQSSVAYVDGLADRNGQRYHD